MNHNVDRRESPYHAVAEAASLDPWTPDPMSWQRAEALLVDAGWQLRELMNGEIALAVGDETPRGILLECRPGPEEKVDGHALLRGAGGGALDVALAASVTVASSIAVDEVLVGLNWTWLRAGARCGVARSPERGTQGARSVRCEVPLVGRSLAELAGWLCSLDPLRRSIGLAAVNAFWNRPVPSTKAHQGGLERFASPGDGLVVVGGFRAAMAQLPNARVIEREPQGRDLSVADADSALDGANAIAITAQTLMNGSLEPLLAKASALPTRLLLGPSAPVTPVLFEHGLTAVAGRAITHPDMARAFVAETGAMIALDHLSCPLELAR